MAKNQTAVCDELESISKATGDRLAAEPKVRILIPLDVRNKEEKAVSIGINGYFYTIARGESVEAPQSVAALLKRAGYI